MTGSAYLAVLALGAGRDAGRRIAERAASVLPLAPSFERDDLHILVSANTAHRTFGQAGFAVGQLVSGPAGTSGRPIGTSPSDGHRLVSSFWGDYVAFLCGTETDPISVIRSPSGGVAAYRTAVDAVTLISSDVEFLLALMNNRPAIDWHFVAHHLAFPHLRASATGLAGIDELFAGDCTVFHGKDAERFAVWSPWDFAAADRQITDPTEARSLVRRAVVEAVSGLTASHRSVLLELSGGLDSSVLAAALGVSGVRASALNLVTPGSEGDERTYARATAACVGLALDERQVADDVDLTQAVQSRTPRPGIPAILRPADRLFGEVARSKGVDAFVSGTGGDCIFCSPASAAPAADALRMHGPGRRFVRAVHHIAEIHDTTLWIAGSMAWRQALRPPIHRVWPNTNVFLAESMLPREPDFHPWLAEPLRALPGRRSHIRSVVAAFAHLDGYARHAMAPSVFPLLSQPVMEACFRVPTWMWVDGGRDRAVAREAFRDRLPAEIINRRTKGGMDAYCIRNFEANRARLEPFLLEGHLADAGLLDRPAVAAFLRQPVGVRDDRVYRLFPIIDVEAWLRGWLGDPSGAAAARVER